MGGEGKGSSTSVGEWIEFRGDKATANHIRQPERSSEMKTTSSSESLSKNPRYRRFGPLIV